MVHRLASLVFPNSASGASSRQSILGAFLLVAAASLVYPIVVFAQATRHPLESTAGLRLHNVVAEPATLHGKKGLRVTMSQEASARLQRARRDAQGRLAITDRTLIPDQLAVLAGLTFTDGVIEAEIAGAPAPGASSPARGFVGIAFRVHNDLKTFEAIYLRPTNGRAEDQEPRNHAVQYISHPEWPWYRLRKETPSKYE